jgi:hypothetical protein
MKKANIMLFCLFVGFVTPFYIWRIVTSSAMVDIMYNVGIIVGLIISMCYVVLVWWDDEMEK